MTVKITLEVTPEFAALLDEAIATGHFAEFPIVESGIFASENESSAQAEITHSQKVIRNISTTIGAQSPLSGTQERATGVDILPSSGEPEKKSYARDTETLPSSATNGSQLEFPEDPPEVHGYKILSEIGRGKNSRVFLALDEETGSRVAIKATHFDETKAQILPSLRREAQAYIHLQSKYIVKVFALLRSPSWRFLVMEFVDGGDFYHRVKQFGPLSVADAAKYVAQAAHGLQCAFEADIVHRDIKPGNLLLSESENGGTLKIVDYGSNRFSSKLFSSQLSSEFKTLMRSRNVIGTPDYVAPEQISDSHDVDIRADIYSLGCSFFYLLTGRPPFVQFTVHLTLMAHEHFLPPLLKNTRDGIPAAIESIVAKMLAKVPANRYQQPIEVAKDLELFLSS